MTDELPVEEFYAIFVSKYDTLKGRRWTDTVKDVNFIESFLERGDAILDVGCGTGRHCLELAKRGYKVAGIDVSDAMLSKARKKAKRKGFQIEFKYGDMRNIPVDDESFDCVICLYSAFCHLLRKRDRKKAIAEMRRVLKKGGTAIIGITNWSYIKKIYKGEVIVEDAKVELIPKKKRTITHTERMRDGEIKTRLYYCNALEFKDLMQGFDVKFYGDYNRNVEYKKDSRYLIAVGRKIQEP
jgi:ubiquinone/menaquinone biosynthesis C-methylase UbiE